MGGGWLACTTAGIQIIIMLLTFTVRVLFSTIPALHPIHRLLFGRLAIRLHTKH